MRILFFISKLMLMLALLSVATVSLYELQRRHEASTQLVIETQPLTLADNLLAEKRWQEARLLSAHIIDTPELGDTERAKSIELAAISALDSLPIQTQAFLKGAISGEPDNGSGFLGALTLDLFVIGDVRDLVVQGWKEIKYDDGDKVILALSAAGLSMTLLPELHWAPSIMKGLKRTGSLSKPFTRVLTRLSKDALKTRNFRPLGKVLSDFGSATRHLGIGPIKGAMKAVNTEKDLSKLANAAAKSPRKTYALAHLTGNAGVKQVSKNGGNLLQVTKKIKILSRVGKISKKSLGVLPHWLLAFLVGVSLFWVGGLLIRVRK